MICDYPWKKIQADIRKGLGRNMFPIGTQFVVRRAAEDGPALDLVFDVVDHDGYTDPRKPGDHSMTLLMRDVWYGHAMDAREALFFCEADLPPGTYWFTVIHQEWFDEDNGRSFQFTLADTAPAGSQLLLTMKYNETIGGKLLEVYRDGNDRVPCQCVEIRQGSEGTFLGVTDGTSKNLNHMHRAVFGSNNYKESTLRQWLNSAGPKGRWWTPQTRFDRPAVYTQEADGFLNGLEAGFIDVVRPVRIPVRHNEIYEQDGSQGNTTYAVQDRFFIPSLEEMGYESEGVPCGQVFQMYKDTSPLQRAKNNIADSASTDRKWWLRVPKATNACSCRLVAEDGSLFVHTGYYGFGVAIACVI